MVNRMAAMIPCRMFSQRGSTCGTDTVYTILFEADPIRIYFASLLKRNPLTMIASKDDLVAAMGYAIQRRNKMLSLPELTEPPKLLRCNSLNTGEGKEMLLRSTMGNMYGVTFDSVASLLEDLLVRDYFNVLPPSMKIQISHMRIPEESSAAKNIKLNRAFAIILGIDYFMGPPPPRTYNSNSNNNERYSRKYYRYKGGNLTRCTYGHEIGFFTQDNDWYFVDNVVGWLHKITDPAFVTVHVMNALQKGEPINFLESDLNWEKQLNFIIMADGVTYGGEPFSLEDSHYKTTEVHVLMTSEPAKGGRTRRQSTRYRAHRRASRRC
jgi:hypothetical protein